MQEPLLTLPGARAGRGFLGYSVICPDGTAGVGDAAGGWRLSPRAARAVLSFLPLVAKPRGEIAAPCVPPFPAPLCRAGVAARGTGAAVSVPAGAAALAAPPSDSSHPAINNLPGPSTGAELCLCRLRRPPSLVLRPRQVQPRAADVPLPGANQADGSDGRFF